MPIVCTDIFGEIGGWAFMQERGSIATKRIFQVILVPG